MSRILDKMNVINKIRERRNKIVETAQERAKEDERFDKYMDLIHLQQDMWALERHIRKNKHLFTEIEFDNLMRVSENMDELIELQIGWLNNPKDDNKDNIKLIPTKDGKLLLTTKKEKEENLLD